MKKGGGRGGGGGGGKKESILELAKVSPVDGRCRCDGTAAQHRFTYFLSSRSQFVDSQVRVKCLGGRELRGALRGYDELVNLVLDDCEEFIRGEYSLDVLIYSF